MITTTLFEAVKEVLSQSESSLTPQEIREAIKVEHQQFYNTESHQRNVAQGHYKNIDHALLAQI